METHKVSCNLRTKQIQNNVIKWSAHQIISQIHEYGLFLLSFFLRSIFCFFDKNKWLFWHFLYNKNSFWEDQNKQDVYVEGKKKIRETIWQDHDIWNIYSYLPY